MTHFAKSIKQVDAVTDQAPVRRLSCIEALRERRGDVVCFTPAILVTRGRMPSDPAQEFIARFSAPADKQPFCVELPPGPNRFFRGLGMSTIDNKLVDWDRRLYAIAAARADLCFSFLGGIGIHAGDFYASSVAYQIDIPDPTSPIVGAGTSIPVHVFGVLIADKIAYLAPDGNSAPYLTVVDAAEQITGFKKNPVTFEELKRLRGEI
jgi:hypothetical protein